MPYHIKGIGGRNKKIRESRMKPLVLMKMDNICELKTSVSQKKKSNISNIYVDQLKQEK